jgi:uncharacterized protein YbjT (DUF2867 family)
MTILITGATGNVGRPLINQLLAAGADVCAVSREPSSADLPAAVEVVASPFAGLRGADAVFVNSRALSNQLSALVATAARCGVRRLVALSALNADDDDSRQPSRLRGDRNREADQLAAGSGISWVSLRPTLFASNFIGMWAAQIRGGNAVYGPHPTASLAPIADADVAAVAARALLTDDLLGQRIPMTGPQALTNEELVGVIATVLGRPLRYREISAQTLRERFAQIGFPTGFADAYAGMLATTLDRPAEVTHDVEKILGRPATPFGEWVAAHRSVFAAGR